MSLKKNTPILSFDLDGTLMKPGFGNKVWLEGLPKIYAQTHKITYKKAKEQLLTAYDTIGNTRREWYDLSYWIKELNLNITPDELLEEFSAYIHPYPEVPSLIKQLSNDYELIISSSAMKPFIKIELQTAKLFSYFTDFFSATSDTNTIKKDPYFYKMIVEKVGCNPNEMIHVGDNQQFDYVSPKKAGLYAFYLDRTASTKQDYVISSLTEIKNIVKKYPFK